MAASARVHVIQIELSGEKIVLYGNCVREIDDDGEKVNSGNCTVEIEVTAAEVKPLLDKVKKELTRLAGLPSATAAQKRFVGLMIL